MARSLVLSIAIVASLAAADKVSTAPGKYKEWKDLDEIEIVKTFKLADFAGILVEPIDTSKTPLPGADDNSYEPAKKALAAFTPVFVDGLKERVSKDKKAIGRELPVTTATETNTRPPVDGKWLTVRGRVDNFDPGSRAARYFGGFGAGAAIVKVSGEIAETGGDVLIRFTQERRSGVGAFGGSYDKLLQRSGKEIGQDVGSIFREF
jgi:hypothetical protein